MVCVLRKLMFICYIQWQICFQHWRNTSLPHKTIVHAQIYKGDTRSRVLLRVMAPSTMGLKLVIFGILPTTQAKINTKQMHPRIFARCVAFYTYLSSCSDHRSCRWHTHLMNHGYFDYMKTWRPPIWAPCWDKNGAGSGISLVYLWQYYLLNFHSICFWNTIIYSSPYAIKY